MTNCHENWNLIWLKFLQSSRICFPWPSLIINLSLIEKCKVSRKVTSQKKASQLISQMILHGQVLKHFKPQLLQIHCPNWSLFNVLIVVEPSICVDLNEIINKRKIIVLKLARTKPPVTEQNQILKTSTDQNLWMKRSERKNTTLDCPETENKPPIKTQNNCDPK